MFIGGKKAEAVRADGRSILSGTVTGTTEIEVKEWFVENIALGDSGLEIHRDSSTPVVQSKASS